MLKTKRMIDVILGLLFPERCSMCDRVIASTRGGICRECEKIIPYINEPRCKKCGKQIKDEVEEFCHDCMKRKHYFDKGVCLLRYDDRVSHSMYRFKYGNRQRYALFFADKIAERLYSEIKSFDGQVIVPVPLHRRRHRKRGYNQAQLLARRLSERLSIPMREDLVSRERDTKAMKLLDPTQRPNNLKKAFKLSPDSVKYSSIILVDDIFTTGSTVDEIASMFKEAGVKRVYFVAAATGDSQ